MDRDRCQDEDYAMFCSHDGTEARLYDLRADPKMDRDVAVRHQDIAKRMFRAYVIEDAGGPLSCSSALPAAPRRERRARVRAGRYRPGGFPGAFQ